MTIFFVGINPLLCIFSEFFFLSSGHSVLTFLKIIQCSALLLPYKTYVQGCIQVRYLTVTVDIYDKDPRIYHRVETVQFMKANDWENRIISLI